MINHKLEYINYDPKLHVEFPTVTKYSVYSKNGIINLTVEGSNMFNEIVDDIGYDNQGKYISLSIGQWHHSETGKFISNEEFFDLDEYQAYLYDYVSVLIKIYVKEDYRTCYHNDFDRKIVISFIPYGMINFTEKDCGV